MIDPYEYFESGLVCGMGLCALVWLVYQILHTYAF